MACSGCSNNSKDGQGGCGGNCSGGGCERRNTFDWLAIMGIEDIEPFNVVEVSFKNGARKGFFYNQPFTRAVTGDTVVVEAQAGYDVGRITLSGELVRLQLRKKKVAEDSYFPKILRRANPQEVEKLQQLRGIEMPTMVRARAIARTLDLNMKVGDVEYQGDGKKATFYYTADGRVDFRELIRHYAKEFKVKIEMRQIGARQEAARIGGIGPSGRELCCSTWLNSYRTVSTAAARYQNLAINQAKLTGMCGRLKCCLNYELDTYMEALSNFPEDAEKLRTQKGIAALVKTDIFKGLMYYSYEHEHGRGRMYPLDLKLVRSVRDMNQRGEFPSDLADLLREKERPKSEEPDFGAGDVTGVIELPAEEKQRHKKKKKREGDSSGRNDRGEKGGKHPDSPRKHSRQGGDKHKDRENQRKATDSSSTFPSDTANSEQSQETKKDGDKGRKYKGRGNKNRFKGNGPGKKE